VSTNGTRLTRTQAWVLALTSAASLMVSLDTQVVATALPVIRVQLHASLAELEWTVNAYTLTFAVLLLTGAALGERLGRRRMLAAGVGLFTAASAGCALAPNAGALVAARAVQGAGAALMLPLALALLSAAFPPQHRAWALGIFSSVTGIAVLAGPVVGGAVAQGLDWPWIFWLNVPIGLVMIPLILARIPAAERSRASLDPLGLLLAATSALGIVWALIRANSLGWTSPEIAAALAAGIVLGAAFVGWELRVADPMVPLRLFRSRPIAAGNAATFSVFALLMAMVFFMAQFLETGLGYGPLGAGLRLLPGWATLTVIAEEFPERHVPLQRLVDVVPDDDRAAEIVGDAYVQLHALRARSRATQHRLAETGTIGAETSIDKVLVATTDQTIYDAVRRLLPGMIEMDDGAAGETWRSEYLFSRAATIYGGTAEVQRNIIARRLLELGSEE